MTDEQTGESPPTNPKPSTVLTVFAVVALGVACLISFAREMRHSGDIVPALGASIAPALICLIVVVAFSIHRNFRNARSQAKIVLWASIVQILVALTQLAQRLP